MNSLHQLLRSRNVAIVAGSGGVGKTTTSAALAIGGALDGRKTLVVTIDPAKRLAQSLGLEEMGHEPTNITQALIDAGMQPKGELWGMMLDMKATLDRFIASVVKDDKTLERIYANKIYQQVTSHLSGSQEYAAMHKLYELKQEADFDLIVLDTPPTTHAMDFLRAPDRLTRFFESGVVQLLTSATSKAAGSAGIAQRLLQRGSGMALGALERLVGKGLFEELRAFFEVVQNAFDPLSAHGDQVEELLRSGQTEFIVVCGPQAGQVDEAVQFFRRVTDLQISAGAVVINRVVLSMLSKQERDALHASDPIQPKTLDDWTMMYEQVADTHAAHVDRVRGDVGAARTFVVDAAPQDLHSIDGLRWIGQQLLGDLFR